MLKTALLAALCAACITSSAEARHHRSRSHHSLPWCGIYMGKITGKHDRKLWVARNWAREGHAASPAPGVIVVWRHHVGRIVGRASNGKWIVHSGNDGGRVRTRPRSVAGAIAFRRV